MRPAQKVLMTVLWALTVLIMVGVIGAGLWRKAEPQLPDLGEIKPFALVDQDNRPVTLETLKGKPFIVDVIFTRCAGPCPLMTGKLASMQKNVFASAAPELRFVSITSDPERDTPEVLKAYAEKFDADQGRWKFLTGSPDAVRAATRAVMLAASKEVDGEIIHSTQFLLVDGDGKLRGIYDSTSEPDVEKLKHDATLLAEDAAAG
jgi:protein SCO1/2